VFHKDPSSYEHGISDCFLLIQPADFVRACASVTPVEPRNGDEGVMNVFG